jgi:hypothetical protein
MASGTIIAATIDNTVELYYIFDVNQSIGFKL